MYDIIGDIHGHFDELCKLLDALGYSQSGGTYRHSTRTAIFVGDFIDRGHQIKEVLETVRSMCSSGSALAVMGNHEFNALAFHTLDPSKPGKYLRPHSDKTINQHSATLAQLSDNEMRENLEWFRQLPMWLELDSLRVVHACWDDDWIAILRKARDLHGGISVEFLSEATRAESELYRAIDDVLKGKEIKLPDGKSHADKDGHARQSMRVQWYRAAVGETYASYALPPNEAFPDTTLPKSAIDSMKPYPTKAPPVFFGHYWLRATKPSRLAPNVACVDYSVAKGGSLCAYRWDGETELSDEKFNFVEAGAS